MGSHGGRALWETATQGMDCHRQGTSEKEERRRKEKKASMAISPMRNILPELCGRDIKHNGVKGCARAGRTNESDMRVGWGWPGSNRLALIRVIHSRRTPRD